MARSRTARANDPGGPRRPPVLPVELDPAPPGSLADGEVWADVAARGLDLTAVEAADVELVRCRFDGVSFTGATLARLRLVDCVLDGCDLSGVVAEEVGMVRVELRGCRMSGFVGSLGRYEDVLVDSCKVDDGVFRMSRWQRAELTRSSLRRLDLYSASLPGARLLGCDLTDASCSAATMEGAHLHGSVLDGLTGGEGLRGVVVGSDQVLALAHVVLAAFGVQVDDDAES